MSGVKVCPLQHGVSDHMTLMLDSGTATHVGNKNVFSFELSWFQQKSFVDLWLLNGQRKMMGAHMSKGGRIRSDTFESFSKVGQNMCALINTLDTKTESDHLTPAEYTTKKEWRMSLMRKL